MKKPTKKTKLEKEIEKQFRKCNDKMKEWHLEDFLNEEKHKAFQKEAAKAKELMKKWAQRKRR